VEWLIASWFWFSIAGVFVEVNRFMHHSHDHARAQAGMITEHGPRSPLSWSGDRQAFPEQARQSRSKAPIRPQAMTTAALERSGRRGTMYHG
jgi:hypothetical protein